MTITNKKLKDALALLDSLSQDANKDEDKSVVNLLTGRMRGDEASKSLSIFAKLAKK